MVNLLIQNFELIFISMNNHALKLVKEKGSISFKVQDLIKMPEDEFTNLGKQTLYENSKAYHKKQKGILRVSKYEFFSSKENRLAMLKKHPLEIQILEKGFEYIEGDDSTKIWYTNFTDKEAFDNRDTPGFKSLTDLQIMEMPLLYKVNRFLNTDCFACISPTTYYKDGKHSCPTPVLFENVPQWVSVRDIHIIKNNQIITRDKTNNIISMQAVSCNSELYERKHLNYLCQTLFAGFGGIISQSRKSKVKNIELHMGNLECGSHYNNNNKELIYLSQLIVASIIGIQKIYFHCVDKDAFSQAQKKFEALEDEFSYEELVSYLESQNHKKII